MSNQISWYHHYLLLWTSVALFIMLGLVPTIFFEQSTQMKNNSFGPESATRRLEHKNQKKCVEYMDQYKVVPGKSWGNLPSDRQEIWKELSCDEAIPEDLVKDADGRTFADRMEQCKTINERYHLLGGGSKSRQDELPAHLKQLWKKVNCPKILNGGKMDSDQITNCLDSNEGSKEKIAVVFAVTTRGVGVGSGDSFVRSLAAFDILLPSFAATAECGFDYLIVMAYDKGDNFYDSDSGQSKVKKWFLENLTTPMKEKGLQVELIMAETDNKVKKPGPAFTAGTKVAYQAGADWFFRVNDDTELLDPWAKKFTKALKELGPPFGVVGPKCYRCNGKILVHDFTHRTHMDIFSKNYYPPQLSDWWMDDWISRVYGSRRTLMATSVKAMHHTSKHGQRYKVDQSHKNFLTGLIKEGHNRIAQYMQNQNIDNSVIVQFMKDRTNGAPYKDIGK
mmetsp:Transcript_1612/g.2050  ORF Transcript_1612/g.2050 Transcript_1612/m.2050 type:complete len:450 (-) Transcript_1612:179-1528(-)